MATGFAQPCQYAGCRSFAIAGSAYCCKHRKQIRNDKFRASAYRRGYTSAWSKAAKCFLIEHPLCAECQRQGRITPATEVDHIIPHKGDKQLFWDQDNWQALCHECHSYKTVTKDGGFGNAPTPRGSQKVVGKS